MPILLLIRGLPGSGTSTQAEEYVAKGYVLVEPHMFYYEPGGRFVFVPNRSKEAYKWCRDQVYKVLLAGRNVVVAGWYIRKCEVEPLRDLARHLKADFQVIVLRTQFKSKHLKNKAMFEFLKSRWEEIV